MKLKSSPSCVTFLGLPLALDCVDLTFIDHGALLCSPINFFLKLKTKDKNHFYTQSENHVRGLNSRSHSAIKKEEISLTVLSIFFLNHNVYYAICVYERRVPEGWGKIYLKNKNRKRRFVY